MMVCSWRSGCHMEDWRHGSEKMTLVADMAPWVTSSSSMVRCTVALPKASAWPCSKTSRTSRSTRPCSELVSLHQTNPGRYGPDLRGNASQRRTFRRIWRRGTSSDHASRRGHQRHHSGMWCPHHQTSSPGLKKVLAALKNQ